MALLVHFVQRGFFSGSRGLTRCDSERVIQEMLIAVSGWRYIAIALLICGCLDEALIKANQQELQQQRAELEQLKQEVAAIQAQGSSYNRPPALAGSCDEGIMREATRKGGKRFAAGDFGGALSYYQDALTACPNSAQANLNVAHAYEAIGDRAQALAHYRAAAASGSASDRSAAAEARAPR